MWKRSSGTACALGLAVLTGCASNRLVQQRLSDVEDRVIRLESTSEQSAADARTARAAATSAAEAAREAARLAQLARDVAVGRVRRDEVRKVTVYFDLGSAALSSEARLMLHGVAEEMQREPSYVACILGHTDASGTHDFNLALSKRRAESVHRFLAEVLGNGMLRLALVGFGEDQPVEDNDTPFGRRQNRRVEISLVRPTPEKPQHASARSQ